MIIRVLQSSQLFNAAIESRELPTKTWKQISEHKTCQCFEVGLFSHTPGVFLTASAAHCVMLFICSLVCTKEKNDKEHRHLCVNSVLGPARDPACLYNETLGPDQAHWKYIYIYMGVYLWHNSLLLFFNCLFFNQLHLWKLFPLGLLIAMDFEQLFEISNLFSYLHWLLELLPKLVFSLV